MEVGEVGEESLGELLVKSRKSVISIENHDNRTSQAYKDLIIETILDLERVSVIVSSLRLFSNNETIDDVSTSSLKFMAVNAYLGFVHQQHYDYPNRKIHVSVAKEYYKDFHHLCQLYGLAVGAEVELNRLDNPVNKDNRAAKLQKYKAKKELEEKLAELEKRDEDKVEEELQRDIYLTNVKLWLIRSEDELYNINTELQMLEHMEKIRGGKVKPVPVIKPKVMKPFIIVKTELQKRVFGAGYPSLPTMTLNELYDQELKRLVEEQNNQKPEPPAPEDPDEETEESLGKARAWDEWKDTHKRGWGNRHNRS